MGSKRRAPWKLLGCACLVGAALGCAHDQVPGSSDRPEAVDDPLARASRDNAALRRRVQMLEDRVLHLEQGTGSGSPSALGAAAMSTGPAGHMRLPDGRDLPVVRLQAEAAASEPPPRPRADPSVSAGTWHAATAAEAVHPEEHPLVTPRYARSLTKPPSPAVADADDDIGGFVGSDAPAEFEDDARSFRLVGNRLAELSKTERKPEGSGPEPAAAPPPSEKRPKARGNDAIIARYKEAMSMLQAGEAKAAEVAFADFVRDHPRHDYADNALYWKGEAAYDQRDYADALSAFTGVVERYGGGNKAPDALLKIGLCYQNLGDTANARDVLTELVAAYPGARASSIARAKLAEFGH